MTIMRQRAWRACQGAAVLFIMGAMGAPALGQNAIAAAPPGFGWTGQSVILAVHGVGAQIYACLPQAAGGNAWTFREPIASLLADGKTVGRHYAGPTWQLTQGGGVKGVVQASAPGATPADVPLLKLGVTEHIGDGPLSVATTILRLNTKGGVLDGPCETAGELRAAPYSADYLFLR